MTTQLKSAVATLRQQMATVVLQAAKEIPNFGFRMGHADGIWAIEITPDGVVKNFGYAEENCGEVRSLDQLATWELGQLVQVLEARFEKAR